MLITLAMKSWANVVRGAFVCVFLICWCAPFQVSAILLKMIEAVKHEVPSPNSNVVDEASKSEPSSPFPFVDYSELFGEEFLLPDGNWETSNLNILDVKLVEEGLLHVLYASASQVRCNPCKM